MSLLDLAFEPFTFQNKAVIDDGWGGVTTTWTDGATIQAALVLDNDPQIRVAMAEGVKGVYTLITRKDITLEFHDVLKRQSNGRIYRVTSDGDDKHTPSSAGLDMRVASCEEWVLNG